MSFAWAVTDQTRSEPKKPDPFKGYFTDIQRAARRSLPKKPDKELRDLLGLTLVPAGNETDRAKTINSLLQSGPTELKVVGVPEKEAGNQVSGISKHKTSFAQKIVSKLPCTHKKEEECSEREKIISSFAVYFAIVIIVLLIIVTILAATLSATSNRDDNHRSSVNILSPESTSTLKPSTVLKHSTIRTLLSISATSPSKTHSLLSTLSPLNVSKTTITIPISSKQVSNTESGSKTSQNSVSNTLDVSKTTTKPPTTRSETSKVTLVPSGPQTTRVGITTVNNFTFRSTTASAANASTAKTTSNVNTLPAVSKSVSTRTTLISTPQKSFSTLSSAPNKTTNTKPASVSTSSTTTDVFSTTTPPLPTLQQPQITCKTPTCLAAKKTLNRLNYDTSPCSDFYEFACGGWINDTLRQQADSNQRNVPSTVREEERLELLKQLRVLLQAVYYDTDSLAVRVSRRLYQSCMESNINIDTELALVELQDILDVFGMSQLHDIRTNLESIINDARSIFEITPFFTMNVIPLSNGNSGRVFGVQISPPVMYLAVEDYRESFERNQITKQYVSKVSEVLYLYLSSINTTGFPGVPGSRRRRYTRTRRQIHDGVSYEEVYLKVMDSFKVERNISQIIDETTRSSQETNVVTFTTLKDLYPNINWDVTLGARSGNALIQIVNRDYFESLNILYPQYDTENVKLYVFLSVLLQRVWKYVPHPLRNIMNNVGKDSDLIYTDIDCVETTVRLAHEETHAMYVGQYTQDALRNRLNIANLENTISEVFQELLSQAGWIMPDLQRVTYALLSNTKLAFSPVRAYIKETEGITGPLQSFLTLAIELHQQKHVYEMFLVTTAVNEDNLIQDWTSTHLEYESSLNLIAIPTGISVFLDNGNQPNFDFHGYVGSLLANEIIKILIGDMADGFAPDWWGVDNQGKFEPIRQCFTSQLQSLPPGDIGYTIIVNGAFQMIDEVFKTTSPSRTDLIQDTSFSEDMLFFINTAQLECIVNTESAYSVKRTSVNNRNSNNERFKELFSCPRYSPMVTDTQCAVFD